MPHTTPWLLASTSRRWPPICRQNLCRARGDCCPASVPPSAVASDTSLGPWCGTPSGVDGGRTGPGVAGCRHSAPWPASDRAPGSCVMADSSPAQAAGTGWKPGWPAGARARPATRGCQTQPVASQQPQPWCPLSSFPLGTHTTSLYDPSPSVALSAPNHPPRWFHLPQLGLFLPSWSL